RWLHRKTAPERRSSAEVEHAHGGQVRKGSQQLGGTSGASPLTKRPGTLTVGQHPPHRLHDSHKAPLSRLPVTLLLTCNRSHSGGGGGSVVVTSRQHARRRPARLARLARLVDASG